MNLPKQQVSTERLEMDEIRQIYFLTALHLFEHSISSINGRKTIGRFSLFIVLKWKLLRVKNLSKTYESPQILSLTTNDN